MKLVSPLLKHVVYPSLARTGYLRRCAGAGPAVVTYHGVLPEGYHSVDVLLDGNLLTAQALRRQVGLLKSRYNVISPEEFLLWSEGRHELPQRSILLTCDDGLRNTLTDMLPVLQEVGLSCLFFITGASLNEASSMLWYEELELMFLLAAESFDLDIAEAGLKKRVSGRKAKHSVWWEAVRTFSSFEFNFRRMLIEKVRMQLGLPENWSAEYVADSARGRRFAMLNRGELQRLAAAGMGIGAHTLSHPVLSQASADVAWTEISASRSGLEHLLGQAVWALAYPFGDWGAVTGREFEMAERAGFKCAFVNVGGGFGAPTPLFALPRVHVTSDMEFGEFEAHVSGFLSRLAATFGGTRGR